MDAGITHSQSEEVQSLDEKICNCLGGGGSAELCSASASYDPDQLFGDFSHPRSRHRVRYKCSQLRSDHLLPFGARGYR